MAALLAVLTSSLACCSLSSSSFWISASDSVFWLWFIVFADWWPHLEEDGSWTEWEDASVSHKYRFFPCVFADDSSVTLPSFVQVAVAEVSEGPPVAVVVASAVPVVFGPPALASSAPPLVVPERRLLQQLPLPLPASPPRASWELQVPAVFGAPLPVTLEHAPI